MEERRVQQIRKAHREVELAVAQETETGNPVVGAKHYLTAIEIVMSTIAGMDHGSSQAADYFHYQCRQKLEDYYARARLLLQVAEEEGLDVNLEDTMPFDSVVRSVAQQRHATGPQLPTTAFAQPLLPPPLGHGQPSPFYGAPYPQGSPMHGVGYPLLDAFNSIQPLGMPGLQASGSGFIPPPAGVTPQQCAPPVHTQQDAALPSKQLPVGSPSAHVDPTSVGCDSEVPPTTECEQEWEELLQSTSQPATEECEANLENEIPISYFLSSGDVPEGPCETSGNNGQRSGGAAADNEDREEESTGSQRVDRVVPLSDASRVRRMFADDDHMRPGNPSFDELFKKFAELDEVQQ